MPECDGCCGAYDALELVCTDCMHRICPDCLLDENQVCSCGAMAKGTVPAALSSLMEKLDTLEQATARVHAQNSCMVKERAQLMEHNASAKRRLQERGTLPSSMADDSTSFKVGTGQKPPRPDALSLQRVLGSRASELESEIAALERHLAGAARARDEAENDFESAMKHRHRQPISVG